MVLYVNSKSDIKQDKVFINITIYWNSYMPYYNRNSIHLNIHNRRNMTP